MCSLKYEYKRPHTQKLIFFTLNERIRAYYKTFHSFHLVRYNEHDEFKLSSVKQKF